MWHLYSQNEEEHRPSVTFTLGGGHVDGTDDGDEPDKPQGMEKPIDRMEKRLSLFSEQEQTSWQCVWSATTAIPVVHLAFSPDGTLFATCGENDRLVKIWYENRHGKS